MLTGTFWRINDFLGSIFQPILNFFKPAGLDNGAPTYHLPNNSNTKKAQ